MKYSDIWILFVTVSQSEWTSDEFDWMCDANGMRFTGQMMKLSDKIVVFKRFSRLSFSLSLFICLRSG